jgi:hypothetical protein
MEKNWFKKAKQDLVALNIGGAIISLAFGMIVKSKTLKKQTSTEENIEEVSNISLTKIEAFESKEDLENNYYPFRAKPKKDFIPLFANKDFSFNKSLLIVNDIASLTTVPLLASIKQLNVVLINIASVKDLYKSFAHYTFTTNYETEMVLAVLKTLDDKGLLPETIVRVRNKPFIVENKNFQQLLKSDKITFIIDIPESEKSNFQPYFVNILQFSLDETTYKDKQVELLKLSRTELYSIKTVLSKIEDPLDLKTHFIEHKLQPYSLSPSLLSFLTDKNALQKQLLKLPVETLQELLFALDNYIEVDEAISLKFSNAENIREALLLMLSKTISAPKLILDKPVLIEDYDVSQFQSTISQPSVLTEEELDRIVATTIEDGLWQQFTKLSDEETKIVKNIYEKNDQKPKVDSKHIVEEENISDKSTIENNVDNNVETETVEKTVMLDENKIQLLMQGSNLTREEIISLLK